MAAAVENRIKDVLDFFDRRDIDVQIVDDNSMRFNGNLVRTDAMSKVILKNAGKMFNSEKLVTLMQKDPEFTFIGPRAFRALRDKKKGIIRGKLIGDKDIDVKRDSFQYSNLIKVVDIETQDAFLFDTDNERPTRLSIDVWMDSLSKEEKAMAHTDLSISAKIDYNPLSDKPYEEVEFMGQNIKSFNTYIMPEWKKLEVEDATLPSEVQKFFDHLFPSPELQEYIFNWLFTLITSRNHCYLLLNSGMGTGKGTFVEICEQLVHRHNYFVTSESYFHARFNFELQDRKLVFFDEVPVEGNIKNELKYMINEYISIERKGCDPIAKRNFASYIIANNHSHNAKLVPNDRRFSVPDITDKRLLDIFSTEELIAFKGKLKNPEYLARIGWFILQRSWDSGKDFSPHVPWKGKRFYNLCMEALPDWQKFLLTRIKKGDEQYLYIKKLKLEYEIENGSGSKFGGPTKIKSLLEEYKDEAGDSFATLIKVEGKDAIKVADKYLKEEVFEEEIEEEEEDFEDFDI